MKPRCKQQVRRLLECYNIRRPPTRSPWQQGGPESRPPDPHRTPHPPHPPSRCGRPIEAECCQIYNRLPSLAGGRTASTSETDSCTSRSSEPGQAVGISFGNPSPSLAVVPTSQLSCLGGEPGWWCIIGSDPPRNAQSTSTLADPRPRACLDSGLIHSRITLASKKTLWQDPK